MSDILKNPNERNQKKAAVCFSLVVTAFTLAMVALGSVKITIELTVLCVFLSFFSIIAGELILRACHLTKVKAWLPIAFVVGYTAISLSMFALILIFNIFALSAFLIISLSLLLLKFFSPKGKPAHAAIDWTDAASALIFAVAIGFLAKIPISSPTILQSTGVFPLWNDYFLHGITITSFGSPFSFAGNMEIAGVSRHFYHYASYLFPAALLAVSKMSGLAASTSVQLPLGLFIGALGAYAFAVTLGGRIAGFLATTTLICLPGATPIIQSGWFDFFWLVLTHPGAGYAIGLSAITCTIATFYLNTGNRKALLLALAIMFSIILFRVHFFLLLAPPLSTLLAVKFFRIKLRPLILAIVIILIALLVTIALYPSLLKYARAGKYLDLTLDFTLVLGKRLSIFDLPRTIQFLIEILVVLAAVLGVYFFLYPLSLLLHIRIRNFTPTDALPILLLSCFIGLMLFSPVARNNDFTEYKHRHFPLLNVIFQIYTIVYLIEFFEKTFQRRMRFKFFVCCTAIAALICSIVINWSVNPARPDIKTLNWAKDNHDVAIPPGLPAITKYLQAHGKKGDIFAMLATSLGTRLAAPSTMTISLSGMPAFISRPNMQKLRSEVISKIVTTRLNVLEKLSASNSWREAKSLLQSNGIRWLLIFPDETIKWDADRKLAVFLNNGLALYDAGQSASDVTFK